MSQKGYFIRVGDKTSCGGTVRGGNPNYNMHGRAASRHGDLVTCGKDGKTYRIIGGIPGMLDNNVQLAGTLDSISSCPCRAKLLSSLSSATYEKTSRAEVRMAAAPQSEAPTQYAQAAKSHPQPLIAPEASSREPVDAGFCVLPLPSSVNSYEQFLFISPPEGTKELYRSLNGSGDVKAGSILLLVDPLKQDPEQIAHLKAAKDRVDAALAPLTNEEANFLHKHYATIANFSSFADKGIGLAADPVGKYFENIEKILKEIQDTYKNTYLTRGALIGDQFYVKRSQLFKQLDSVLKVGFLNKGMKLGEYTKIKSALGLSTSSITHKWNTSGVSDIDGYAVHIERAAKYVKAMKYSGYAGIGFSALHSANEINEACSIGRESECTKKKYTEIGSFVGGTSLGIGAGYLAAPLCVAIGVGTAGLGGLACLVIAGGTAGYLGSELGSSGGELLGDKVYETYGK
ncbi:PAAR domain-containing protein [Hafnia alvei]|uniref:PAAR domain-containing protein n=1 Tax=Hafnia alvei TaxID=569 RepID=A0ABD7PZD8_HAFAL|nr:PAAR domain-containing protein [Hafnia alvei]TBL65708.1 PAAR domain-containing protein [Hafnia alvei]